MHQNIRVKEDSHDTVVVFFFQSDLMHRQHFVVMSLTTLRVDTATRFPEVHQWLTERGG